MIVTLVLAWFFQSVKWSLLLVLLFIGWLSLKPLCMMHLSLKIPHASNAARWANGAVGRESSTHPLHWPHPAQLQTGFSFQMKSTYSRPWT